jgi:cyclopropane-fatty-acyl-phospholipid synthase
MSMTAIEGTVLQPTHPPSAKHYQHEVLFFQSFLDPYLKYGSGYFAGDDGIDEASVRMLDRAIGYANVLERRGKAVVLDVGSGWGSLHRRLLERTGGAIEYHDVNPSEAQRMYAADAIGSPAWTHRAELESAELPARRYDAVFLHDSFCHLSDKRTMLAKIAAALRPDGRVVVQDTFFGSEELWLQHRAAPTTRFIQEEVFGFAEILPLDALVRDAAAAGLHPTLIEDVTDHYRRTVAGWLARLDAPNDSRFAERDRTVRMLRRGAACMGYSTRHYLAVLAPQDSSFESLKRSLRSLRNASVGRRVEK